MLPELHVWVFTTPKCSFPGGVFTSREGAEAWIRERRLTGILTAYPVDEGCFDWASAWEQSLGELGSVAMSLPLWQASPPPCRTTTITRMERRREFFARAV
jgi:hypothetical protein